MSSPAMQVRSRVPRLAGAAVERARLSVVPRARVQAPKVPFVILVSLLMLGGVVGAQMGARLGAGHELAGRLAEGTELWGDWPAEHARVLLD